MHALVFKPVYLNLACWVSIIGGGIFIFQCKSSQLHLVSFHNDENSERDNLRKRVMKAIMTWDKG